MKQMKETTARKVLIAIVGHASNYTRREGCLFRMLRKARMENEVIQNVVLKRALDFMEQQFEAIRDWCEDDIAILEAEEAQRELYYKEMQRLKKEMFERASLPQE